MFHYHSFKALVKLYGSLIVFRSRKCLKVLLVQSDLEQTVTVLLFNLLPLKINWDPPKDRSGLWAPRIETRTGSMVRNYIPKIYYNDPSTVTSSATLQVNYTAVRNNGT